MDNSFDLFLFMGQSNMAGRGISNNNWPEKPPALISGAGFEFRAISDPSKLYPIEEPFGVNENNPKGIFEPNKKTGSLVTAFTNAYYSTCHVPIIAISASKGGSVIAKWQGHYDYLTDSLLRLKRAEDYCANQHIHIAHKYMAWCQGESDGDYHTPIALYKNAFNNMLHTMLSAGIEMCFMITIGHYNGLGNIDYSPIISAQYELAASHPKVLLVSNDFTSMKARGLMKDEFHYYQAAYNEVGIIAGKNTGIFRNSIN